LYAEDAYRLYPKKAVSVLGYGAYSVLIGESRSIGERVSYDELVRHIIEFTIRAALARSVDQSDWEHDELRKRGLRALQIFRNGKAVWADREIFHLELGHARRQGDIRFEQRNECDPELYGRLEADLRAQWRHAGYDSGSLSHDMKKLFTELERDAAERAAGARESLLNDLLKPR
jgi:hypothetical protein